MNIRLRKKDVFCINILLLTKIDSTNRLAKIKEHRPDITTPQALDEEIATKLLNSYLFASNEIISELVQFNINSCYSSYYSVANAMRKDLWGKKINFISKIEFITKQDTSV